MALSPQDFERRAAKIRLLVMDVDGVLTDGSIQIDSRGRELKTFSVRDGFGLNVWLHAGRQAAVLSGRTSQAVAHRCRELGIESVIQGRPQKGPAFRELLARHRATREEVCFMGDDLPDLPLILASGLGATTADAAEEVRRQAHWTSTTPGGKGAVRELIERLLQAQNAWEQTVTHYSVPAGE